MPRRRLFGETQKRRKKKKTKLLKQHGSVRRVEATGQLAAFEQSPELNAEDIAFLEMMRDLKVQRYPWNGEAPARRAAVEQWHVSTEARGDALFQSMMQHLGVRPLSEENEPAQPKRPPPSSSDINGGVSPVSAREAAGGTPPAADRTKTGDTGAVPTETGVTEGGTPPVASAKPALVPASVAGTRPPAASKVPHQPPMVVPTSLGPAWSQGSVRVRQPGEPPELLPTEASHEKPLETVASRDARAVQKSGGRGTKIPGKAEPEMATPEKASLGYAPPQSLAVRPTSGDVSAETPTPSPVAHSSGRTVFTESSRDLAAMATLLQEEMQGTNQAWVRKFEGAPPPSAPRRVQPRRPLEPDDELDLHGKTQQQAIQMVQGFVQRAHREGLRAVLIITGRGLNSGPGGGVLRDVVHHWLERNGQPFVRAFETAPPAHGGKGALLITLKSPRPSSAAPHSARPT